MEELSPITLRKALAELALPERAPAARDDEERCGSWLWIVLLAAAFCAACAFSVWR
jgi:hypothetical protein